MISNYYLDATSEQGFSNLDLIDSQESLATRGTIGLTRGTDVSLETMRASSTLTVTFNCARFCQQIGRQDVPNARVEWMSASTRRLYSNIQGNPFLATQGLESCSKLIFIFVRTFPAAIAGRGDYFHYDIETKEAVRHQILFHIMNILYSLKIHENKLLQCNTDFDISMKITSDCYAEIDYESAIEMLSCPGVGVHSRPHS